MRVGKVGQAQGQGHHGRAGCMTAHLLENLILRFMYKVGRMVAKVGPLLLQISGIRCSINSGRMQSWLKTGFIIKDGKILSITVSVTSISIRGGICYNV